MSRPPSFPPSARRGDADEPDETASGRPAGSSGREVERSGDAGRALARPTRQPRAARVTAGLTDRLSERQAARRRLRVRGVVIAAVLALLLGAAGWVGLASPVLALEVDDVTVVGADALVPADEVMAVVAEHEGEPLLRLDTGGLRERLLELAAVQDVAIARALPNGLVVTVTPRVPVASVAGEGGFVLLDAEGVQLTVTPEPTEGVPVVEVPVGTEDTADALASVLAVLEVLEETDLLPQVEEASATTAYEVSLTLGSGSGVVWGGPEESELKAAVLLELLAVPAEVYDVSAPLSPITR